MLTRALREIFRTNLGVKKNEQVLVFTDRPSKSALIADHDRQRWERLKDIAMLTEETGRSFARDVLFSMFPARKGHGVEPPENLWKMAYGEKVIEQLKDRRLLTPLLNKKASAEQLDKAEGIIRKNAKKAVDVVIALSNYSTSHTRFRDFLTRICDTRYASMPLFDIDMFEGAMNVDWKALERRTKAIARIVNKAEMIEVKTENGTHIRLAKKGRKTLSDTGILRKPGSFGNLPAGEVFFAPIEGTAQGKLVIDWAPTHRLESPITLIVSNGVVVDVDGDDPYAEALLGKISEREENRNIAELGIGTNDHATRADNILESEKILGTIHIALGDNSSFGGTVKTPFHQDFVFFRPTITLIHKDGTKEVLMRTGKLIGE